MKDTVAERLVKNSMIARRRHPLNEKKAFRLLKLTGRKLKAACWESVPTAAQDILLAATVDHQLSVGKTRPSTSHKGILEEAFIAYLTNDKTLYRCPGCNAFTLPLTKEGSGKYRPAFCSIACMNKCAEVVKRRRETCKARYGTEEANLNADIAEKRNTKVRAVQRDKRTEIAEAKRNTSLQNWGVEHHMKNPVFQAETSRRNLALNTIALGQEAYFKKTGYLNPMKNPDSLAKMLKTKVDRYGTTSSKAFMKSNRGAGNFATTRTQQALRVDGGKLRDRVLSQTLTVPAVFRGEKLMVGSKIEASFVAKIESSKNVARVLPGTKLPSIRVRERRYFPDLGVVTSSGKKVLVEVKSTFTFKAEASKVIACALAAVKVARAHGGVYMLAVSEGKGSWKIFKNPTRAQLTRYLISVI